jgi:hypothetical protein
MTPVISKNYYRLKTHKIDGSFFFSSTKQITLEDNNDPFHVFPNPCTNSIQIATKQNETLLIRVFTNDGKLVSNKTVSSNKTIPLDHLPPGFYYAEIKGKNLSTIKKIIKQ